MKNEKTKKNKTTKIHTKWRRTNIFTKTTNNKISKLIWTIYKMKRYRNKRKYITWKYTLRILISLRWISRKFQISFFTAEAFLAMSPVMGKLNDINEIPMWEAEYFPNVSVEYNELTKCLHEDIENRFYFAFVTRRIVIPHNIASR